MLPPESSGRDDLHEALARLGVGVISVDTEGGVVRLSPFAERLTGWETDDAKGRPLEKVFRVVRKRQATAGAADKPAVGLGVTYEGTLISRTGQRLTIEYTVAIEHARATTTVVFHDVTQHRLAGLQIARRDTHDQLTGLMNRDAFSGSIERALAEIDGAGQMLTVCQIDIEQLGFINKTCGYLAGDNLIQWVAALLREEARENHVLARLAGDVFGILTIGAGSLDEARRVAESVLGRLQRFLFTWAHQTFPVGASIGLVPVSRGDHGVADVLSAAEHACSQARGSGRNQISVCSLQDEELSLHHQEIEWVTRIKKNLSEGGVALFAQPIRPLKKADRDGLHFEVLMRIPGDDGLLKSAAGIIRATERYGLMSQIDQWVVRTTLRVLKEQPKEVIDRLHLCSINLSAVSVHDRSLFELIRHQVEDSGVAPEKICFELTESAAVENLKLVQALMGGLRSMGCRFALDDFGMGVSSYAHLKHLPVDYLKIAGDFIEDIAINPLDHAMVESITQIGRVLGVQVIAESVSSQGALEVVRSLGVDYAQGNHVGAPLPIAELLRSDEVRAHLAR